MSWTMKNMSDYVVDSCCFPQLSRCFACDLSEGLTAERLSLLTLLAAAHVCQHHMLYYVASCILYPLYTRDQQGQSCCPHCCSAGNYFAEKLGHLMEMTFARTQYFLQWKDTAAVREYLRRKWHGSGDGTVPCWTKRIMKTKQFWQVWNLRTHPGRYEDYKCQAVSWKSWQIAVPPVCPGECDQDRKVRHGGLSLDSKSDTQNTPASCSLPQERGFFFSMVTKQHK